mmetsp:Transcript_59489/g.141667  ORF Transcript_59489/g.141667 Transcript_59489/m.141667 type:complete len:139 (-) Transcript_59489:25-441(-)
MPFYESIFLLHGKYTMQETRLLLRETGRIITQREGAIFRILDLGWRHTPRPIRQPRVGWFYYGRWWSLTWGGPPGVVKELGYTFQHNTGVLRHRTESIRHPWHMYTPRTTFYPKLSPSESPAGARLQHHHPPEGALRR